MLSPNRLNRFVSQAPTVAYCVVGVTACALALAVNICGFPDAAVFDGSWEEWTSQAEKTKKWTTLY